MTSHVNEDGSNTDGTRVEPNASMGYDLGVTCATAATLPSVATMKTAGAEIVTIQCDYGSTSYIRYRTDGTAPTATVGMTLAPGASIDMSITEAGTAQFIQAAATATINASYSK
jgi:hypothetical protein